MNGVASSPKIKFSEIFCVCLGLAGINSVFKSLEKILTGFCGTYESILFQLNSLPKNVVSFSSCRLKLLDVFQFGIDTDFSSKLERC